jgi:hypothetical protein
MIQHLLDHAHAAAGLLAHVVAESLSQRMDAQIRQSGRLPGFGDDLMGSLPGYGLQAFIGQQQRRIRQRRTSFGCSDLQVLFQGFMDGRINGHGMGLAGFFLFEGNLGFNLAGGVQDIGQGKVQDIADAQSGIDSQDEIAGVPGYVGAGLQKLDYLSYSGILFSRQTVQFRQFCRKSSNDIIFIMHL